MIVDDAGYAAHVHYFPINPQKHGLGGIALFDILPRCGEGALFD